MFCSSSVGKNCQNLCARPSPTRCPNEKSLVNSWTDMFSFVSGLNIYSLGSRFLMSWGFYLHCLSPLFWPFAPIRGSCYCYLSLRWEINILHIYAPRLDYRGKTEISFLLFLPFLWPWVNFVRLVKSARDSSGAFIEAICGTARPSLPQFPAILGARLDSKLLLERKKLTATWTTPLTNYRTK